MDGIVPALMCIARVRMVLTYVHDTRTSIALLPGSTTHPSLRPISHHQPRTRSFHLIYAPLNLFSLQRGPLICTPGLLSAISITTLIYALSSQLTISRNFQASQLSLLTLF